MATRKEYPVGSPGKFKCWKHDEPIGEDEEEVVENIMQIVKAEVMPGWAVQMQTLWTKHTDEQISGSKVGMDEAEAMAMEAQENRSQKFESQAAKRNLKALDEEKWWHQTRLVRQQRLPLRLAHTVNPSRAIKLTSGSAQ